ncbi:phosphomannomutase, partial [Candidatus Falkowbacteria bacterium]
MKINHEIIRGYDLRGVVGKDLDAKITKRLGQSYGTYIKKKGVKKVIVGMDSRAHSEELKVALINGLIETGLDVIDIGLTLVGHLYWSQYHFGTKGAIMITASHN